MRTSIVRSLQALVSLSAVVILTGANDPGCMPSTSGEGTGGDTTTSGGSAGGSPGACASDEVEQWICGGGPINGGMAGSGTGMSGDGQPPPPPPPPGSNPPADGGMDCNHPPPPPPPCEGADCPPPPPPPGCVLHCVPAGESCPAGFHQETLCPPPPPPPPPMDPNAPAPSGTGQMKPPPPDPAACLSACVPDGACPPGTMQQTVCSGGAAPSDPMDPNAPPPPPPPPGEGMCWNECVPVNPMPN